MLWVGVHGDGSASLFGRKPLWVPEERIWDDMDPEVVLVHTLTPAQVGSCGIARYFPGQLYKIEGRAVLVDVTKRKARRSGAAE